MTTINKTALIAMSGGVDSAVAAYLMKLEGYDCQGGIMRLRGDGCGGERDVADAQAVADKLEIPLHVFSLQEDFSRQVIDRFVACYEKGWTPNPCIDCNRYLKFDRLYEKAKELGLSYIVTGHYARITQGENGRWQLLKGPDPKKDQSYVLYALTQEQLSRTLFPLSALSKEEVRAIAQARGFLNAHKRDSQDICFVPDGDYAAFIRRRTGRDYPPGDFVDTAGNILGRHKGLIHYTVGQRRGLGVSGGRPLYVKELRPEENRVVLASNEELFTCRLVAEGFNWVSIPQPEKPLRANARARYHHPEQPATVTVLPDGRVEVVFDQPQRALTQGQSVVLYQGDTVLGGGIICRCSAQPRAGKRSFPFPD